MYGATALPCTQTKSALEPTSRPLSAKPQPHAITTSVQYIGACGTNTSIADSSKAAAAITAWPGSQS